MKATLIDVNLIGTETIRKLRGISAHEKIVAEEPYGALHRLSKGDQADAAITNCEFSIFQRMYCA
ncbi:MAG: hypothetical protein OXH34_03965 [Bacteroidetes bacterium]|nr:hypothetical protein [Bacteroidota bacterium]MCY3595788.1 hypothetical protein [Bacteroidota bacterium]